MHISQPNFCKWKCFLNDYSQQIITTSLSSLVFRSFPGAISLRRMWMKPRTRNTDTTIHFQSVKNLLKYWQQTQVMISIFGNQENGRVRTTCELVCIFIPPPAWNIVNGAEKREKYSAEKQLSKYPSLPISCST